MLTAGLELNYLYLISPPTKGCKKFWAAIRQTQSEKSKLFLNAKSQNAQQRFEVEMPERQAEKRDAAALTLTSAAWRRMGIVAVSARTADDWKTKV